jgi:hypothetical protein
MNTPEPRDCNERTYEDPNDYPDASKQLAHDKKLTDAARAGVTSTKLRRSHRTRWNHGE